jgi:predicted nucleic acid-binding protein
VDQELVGIGDLVHCEVMQGVRHPRQRAGVSSLLLSLARFDMVGFRVADRSATNYRLLRSKGVTVRKTIDVLIGTFGVERGFAIVHFDADFDRMAAHIGLEVWSPPPSRSVCARRGAIAPTHQQRGT